MDDLNLTEEEIEFCEINNIDYFQIFNALGMAKKEWRENIEFDEDIILVANTTPCNAYGHTLRTRRGHCAICNPIALRKQLQFYKSGYVYLAYSDILGLIKIGSTIRDIDIRINLLNNTGYAGANDWELVKFFNSRNAAYDENQIHNELSNFRENIEYVRNDNFEIETTREIFDCDIEVALEILNEYFQGT